MTKAVDIGSKRLISLAPSAWVRWVTGDSTIEAVELLSGDFQWVARANDVLVKVRSAQYGEFLVANEIQLRADVRMAERLRAYAALAEERYALPVFPVVVNILRTSAPIASAFHSELMGLVAHQDFRVLNLWEIEAEQVFAQQLTSLLPFVPILKSGYREDMLRNAVIHLRANQDLAELEPLLAFFASFVMNVEVVRKIMRWDMTILRESPWYNEILKEGLQEGFQQGVQKGIEQGVQQGIEQGVQLGIEQGIEQGVQQARLQTLLQIIQHRFGDIPEDVDALLRRLASAQLQAAIEMVLDASTIAHFRDLIEQLPPAGKVATKDADQP